jgi:acetyl esterase
MPSLASEAEKFLELREEVGVLPYDSVTPDAARRLAREQMATDSPAIDVAKVRNFEIPGPNGSVPVRAYEPEINTKVPVIIFFHGGGWVVNDLETHDSMCRQLTSEGQFITISVDYCRAPEHPFPQPLEDCYAAVEWVEQNVSHIGGNPEQLAVVGDSAGGNLAASTALLARDRNGPDISHQVLLYPVTNYDFGTESYEERGEGYIATKQSMISYWNQYLPSEIHGANKYASPLREVEFNNLPPATVLTCEFDPLRDEGAAYANKLDEGGVLSERLHIDDMFHGYLQLNQFLERSKTDLDIISNKIHQI